MTAIPLLRDLLPRFCPRCAALNVEDEKDFILTGDPTLCDNDLHIENMKGGSLVL